MRINTEKGGGRVILEGMYPYAEDNVAIRIDVKFLKSNDGGVFHEEGINSINTTLFSDHRMRLRRSL